MWESIATGSAALGLAGLLFKSLDKKVDGKANQSDCTIHVRAMENALVKGEEKFDKIMVTNSEILQTLARIDERTKKSNGGV